ncbi:MAG: hypothetical protein M0017_11425, partial [Desulfobacteraceae bacterium]|nr:hypothetical protein [Desulfobacteraceae bacterium]
AAMSLVNICVESSQSSATSGGVIIALPSTTDLAALSAYSQYCSVAQSEPLLGTCNCANPVSGTSGTSGTSGK